METDIPTRQQHASIPLVPIPHNYNIPTALDTIPMGQSTRSSLQVVSHPQSGAIDDTVFGGHKEGQMIRRLQADDEQKLYICDGELQTLYDEVCEILDRDHSIPADPLLKCSTVLQRVFFQPQLSQHVCEALTVAQHELSTLLKDKIQSFVGKEEQLLRGYLPDGPDPMLCSYLGYALLYLQSCQAAVSIDSDGHVNLQGQTRISTHHIIEVLVDRVTFDFRPTWPSTSLLVIRWKDIRPLHTFGISFLPEGLSGVPMPDWFGAPEWDPSPPPK